MAMEQITQNHWCRARAEIIHESTRVTVMQSSVGCALQRFWICDPIQRFCLCESSIHSGTRLAWSIPNEGNARAREGVLVQSSGTAVCLCSNVAEASSTARTDLCTGLRKRDVGPRMTGSEIASETARATSHAAPWRVTRRLQSTTNARRRCRSHGVMFCQLANVFRMCSSLVYGATDRRSVDRRSVKEGGKGGASLSRVRHRVGHACTAIRATHTIVLLAEWSV